MSLQDEHPDDLLQSFLLLTERAERLKTAEQILRASRDGGAFADFLGEPFSLRRTPKTLAMAEFEKRESDLKDEIRSLAQKMAVATVGAELGVDGENMVKQWAGLYFKTLDDLGALTELYETLSKPHGIWTGDRPWQGKALPPDLGMLEHS